MITRRRFLRALALGAASALLPGVGIASAQTKDRRANVLIIVADDMNDYGFYDTLPGVRMPYPNQFKKTAVTFEKAYCAAPACVPSRAAVWGERYEICGETDPARWREFVHAYCACTTFADWSVGRVIEALDKGPYADNPVVVFWSDNGYHCGEKNPWEKTTLWEQAALTPMAVRLPGRRNAGTRCPQPASTLDLFPTLVDYCKLKSTAPELDGLSPRPLLEDPQTGWDRPAITTYGEGCFSVRDKRSRYIRDPDGTEELYDHPTDPHEFTNLAKNPDMETVKRRLGRWVPKEWARSLGGRLG